MSAPADPGGRPWSDVGGDVARAIHDATACAPPAQQWTGGGGTFRVNKDNVRQVAKLVQDTADELEQKVRARAEQMRTNPAMGDPVSGDMAAVLNHRLIDADDSYVRRAQQYVENLRDAVEELKKTALAYGYTDDDITKALQGSPSITLPSADTGNQLAASWASSRTGHPGA